MVDTKQYECDVCYKVFGKKANLARHAKSHQKGQISSERESFNYKTHEKGKEFH